MTFHAATAMMHNIHTQNETAHRNAMNTTMNAARRSAKPRKVSFLPGPIMYCSTGPLEPSRVKVGQIGTGIMDAGVSKKIRAREMLAKSPLTKLTSVNEDQVKTHASPRRIVVEDGVWYCRFSKAHKAHHSSEWYTTSDKYPILGWIEGNDRDAYLVLAKPKHG